MGEVAEKRTGPRLKHVPGRRQSRKNALKRLPRIASADAVIHGVLKIVWGDGHEGIVDLRPTIARGRIFTYLQSPATFRGFTVAAYGSSVGWIGEAGDEIDLDSYNLRQKSENQAKLQQLVAVLNY